MKTAVQYAAPFIAKINAHYGSAERDFVRLHLVCCAKSSTRRRLLWSQLTSSSAALLTEVSFPEFVTPDHDGARGGNLHQPRTQSCE